MTELKRTEIKCAWVMRSIDAALDGELFANEMATFNAHLEVCSECGAEYATAQSLKQILALGDTSIVFDEPLEESTDIVMSRIRNVALTSRSSTPSDNRRLWMIGSLSLAASLLIFSILMWYSARMMHYPEFATTPSNRTTSLGSPMLVAASASEGGSNMMTAEEEAILSAGMMTLATPGVMSRIEAVASSRIIPASPSTDSTVQPAKTSRKPR